MTGKSDPYTALCGRDNTYTIIVGFRVAHAAIRSTARAERLAVYFYFYFNFLFVTLAPELSSMRARVSLFWLRP